MRREIAVTEWVLEAPSVLEAIEIAAEAGYRAIELSADPEMDVRAVRERLDRHGMTVPSLCGMYSLERDCAAADTGLRRRATDYLRRSLALAAELGARCVITVPTYRVEEDADRERELERAADSIRAAVGDVAEGPSLVLEPLNRYETHLVNTIAEADELRQRIGSPQVRLMADVFHMNLEEDSTTDAIRRHAAHLAHVHVADNQRREPGSGELDFASIGSALDEVGYEGALALEFVPATREGLVSGREYVQRLTGPLSSNCYGRRGE